MGTAKQLSGMFGGGSGSVEFFISGNNLKGVLNRNDKNVNTFS